MTRTVGILVEFISFSWALFERYKKVVKKVAGALHV
jgi:hypothetical protein